MSDIILFRLPASGPCHIDSASAVLEKSFQTLIETHLEKAKPLIERSYEVS